MVSIIQVNRAQGYIIRELQSIYPRAVSAKELAHLMSGFSANELSWQLSHVLNPYVDVTAIETSGKRTGMKLYSIKPEYRFCGLDDEE